MGSTKLQCDQSGTGLQQKTEGCWTIRSVGPIRIVTHSRYTYSLHAASVDAMRKQATPDIRERFGFALKSRREELDLTQEEFAERAGIHRT
jgi:hypothetical protein